MKKFKILLVILFFLAGGFGGWLYLQDRNNPDLPELSVMTVTKGDIEDVVTAQGKLEPKEYVDVGVQVSGQLQKLHVEVGDTVKEGDLLAEIDPEIFASRVRADEARLKTLQAQLAQQDAESQLARDQHKRNEKLIAKQAISKETFDTTRTALQVSDAKRAALKAQIEEAQSTLEGNRANLGYAKVYAPMAGTVVTQDLREGQTLNASQSSPTLLRIANLQTMTVRAQAAEADVPRIKAGTPAYFTTLGAQSRKWEGAVRQVLPSPEEINSVVLYNVLIDVDNKDGLLMTGMSTQVFFVLGRADDVNTLPVAALGKRVPKEDNDSGEAYRVKVKSGKGTVEKTVHIGLMSRTLAEVRAGLSVGDQIIADIPAPKTGNVPRRFSTPRL